MQFYYEIYRAATKIYSRNAQQLEFIAEVVGKFRIFVLNLKLIAEHTKDYFYLKFQEDNQKTR